MYDPGKGKDADFNDLDPALARSRLSTVRGGMQGAAGYRRATRRRPHRADAAVSGMAFDDIFAFDGALFSLWLDCVHMMAEYARYNGHADLLCEAIDGTTGRRRSPSAD